MQAHDRVVLRRGERPGACGEAVDEEDRFDDRVLRVDGGPVSLRDDAVAVLVADEELVVAREEAHRRRGLRVRPRGARQLEKSATDPSSDGRPPPSIQWRAAT